MPVYYRSEQLLITHQVIRIRGPQPRAYLIQHVADIVEIPGNTTWTLATPGVVRLYAGGASGLAAIVAAFSLHADGQLPISWIVIMTTVYILGAALSCVCVRRRPYTLCVTYQRRTIMVHHCIDKVEYGKVKRALIRALENRDDTR